MDLLGSILNSMDKPPQANEKQKAIMKKRKEEIEKMQKKEKDELNRFRRYTEDRIERFLKDNNRKSLQFQPLEKIYRTIVHDVAEVAGLLGISFGMDGFDRYTMVYKKECPPSEDEVAARRNGEDWNEEVAKKYAEKRKHMEDNPIVDELYTISTEDIKPTSNYKDKYVHLIGQESALEAAKKTETNKSYGFVPSENKKDCRSIEQTMADIRAKKRLKLTPKEEPKNDTEYSFNG